MLEFAEMEKKERRRLVALVGSSYCLQLTLSTNQCRLQTAMGKIPEKVGGQSKAFIRVSGAFLEVKRNDKYRLPRPVQLDVLARRFFDNFSSICIAIRHSPFAIAVCVVSAGSCWEPIGLSFMKLGGLRQMNEVGSGQWAVGSGNEMSGLGTRDADKVDLFMEVLRGAVRIFEILLARRLGGTATADSLAWY
ncbi:hypothetical protein BDZ97DRAFT_2061932 [Flammula alnicola]|nr:hypothetical protein BDZ97DRAFT_2061932 [Flammula alnicola]